MDAGVLDAAAFPATDRDIWLKLVARALKGASFDEALVSDTDDGIAIEPLYERLGEASPLLRRQLGRPWTITQRMDDPDTARATAQMTDDLSNGATGIALVPADSPSAFGLGIESGHADAFLSAIAAKIGERGSIRLESGDVSSGERLSRLSATLHARPIHFGIDPLSAAALSGVGTGLKDLPQHFSVLADKANGGTVFNADGRLIHNAGGSEAQELAFAAASLVEYLRALDAAGFSPEQVLPAIGLCVCADQDQFVAIAKARAVRLIHARIAVACGIAKPVAAHLFMETSYRMLTRRDPETNILRNTIAVFAAGTGGADEIAVLPHTITHGIPDPLARRLARNTQTILIAESHLDHVGDPASGAGGIEALTDALAERAWEIFTGIEREGGLSKTIESGRLAVMIAKARARRAPRPIVGTSLFAMKQERPVTVLGPLRPATNSGVKPVRLDEVVA